MNIEVVVAQAPNSDLLQQQLQVIGADYLSLSTRPNTDPDTGLPADPANPIVVVVYLVDGASQAEQDQAEGIVKAHNPQQLTAEQHALVQAQQQIDSLPKELGTLSAKLKAANAQDFPSVNALLVDVASVVDAILLILPQ